MKQLLEKILVKLMMIGCIGLGASSFYWGITQEALSKTAQKWPSTRGTVLISYVKEPTIGSRGAYWPIIKYQYKVNRAVFDNNTIQFGQNGSTRKINAVALVEKYRVGKEVPVYYNPISPAVSCLEPRQFEDVSYISIIGGILLFLFGFVPLMVNLLLLTSNRNKKRR